MRIIPTWLHGMLDYPMGALLIAIPWLGGFATGGPAMWLPIIAGIAILVQSAMTAYEAGVVRVIPMPAHLGVDVVLGLLMAASPWLFGFAETVFLPHLILGLGAAAAGVMTQTHPSREIAHRHAPMAN